MFGGDARPAGGDQVPAGRSTDGACVAGALVELPPPPPPPPLLVAPGPKKNHQPAISRTMTITTARTVPVLLSRLLTITGPLTKHLVNGMSWAGFMLVAR